MNLMWLLLCLAYSALADSQERDEEAAVLQKDIQDFVRRLTHHQLRTTQNMQQASILPQVHFPLSRPPPFEPNEEFISSPSGFNFPFQSNDGREEAHSFASSFSSVKRPHQDGVAQSDDARAFLSVKDVDDEEHLGEDVEYEKSSTASETHKTSTTQADSVSVSSERTGPFTLKQQQVETVIRKEDDSFSDVYFVAIVAGCCAVGIFGVISAGVCFYRLQKSRKAAADVDYPAYGVTGPCKDMSSPNGDRKLAQSAQMYHYQHQKQQMIAVEKAGSTKNTSASDVDSEEENEEGDYTVYECPGLAPTGEMEVKNPLFHDDSTPVSPPLPQAKSDNIHNN
ncbi:neural proliferation differentiation and control protein 1 [Trichonephila clavata]|uniref:Neural proliferation differentiation and control protein 1 n=1 Tax=Trichonephila clavata TaxID=2740835 RepID=A0A8X6M2Y7_TRICU|nr:neural proliferation differentiation and control protein 1 [Trichonephila clavata]